MSFDTVLAPGLQLPPIGFGTWRATDGAIRDACELSYQLFDTAPTYGTEEILGRALRRRTDIQPIVCTKLPRESMGFKGSLRSFERSARNLGRDVIDILLIHWPQPDFRLVADSWRAMEELVESGRVRAIGVSNFNQSDLDQLERVARIPPAVDQIEMHLYHQQTELRHELAQRNIRALAWSPLGRGGDLLLNPTLASVAAESRATAPQVALAWCRNEGAVALPRSNNRSRIEENADSVHIRLSERQISRLSELDRRRPVG